MLTRIVRIVLISALLVWPSCKFGPFPPHGPLKSVLTLS